MADHPQQDSHLPKIGDEDSHHHHEGPLVHTEVTPQKSPEDLTLSALIVFAWAFLMTSIWTWSSKMEEPQLPAHTQSHSAAPAHGEAGPPASPDTVPTPPFDAKPPEPPTDTDYHKW